MRMATCPKAERMGNTASPMPCSVERRMNSANRNVSVAQDVRRYSIDEAITSSTAAASADMNSSVSCRPNRTPIVPQITAMAMVTSSA